MFTPIGEDEPNLTNIFQMGWNHQLVFVFYWNCLFFLRQTAVGNSGQSKYSKKTYLDIYYKIHELEVWSIPVLLAKCRFSSVSPTAKHVKILVVTITGFRGTETQRGENWAHVQPKVSCLNQVSNDQNPAYIFVVERGLLYNSYIWIRMSHYKDHYELISTVSW